MHVRPANAFFNIKSNLFNVKYQVNPFSTNVPFMDKPGSWFLLAKCRCQKVDDLHLFLKYHSSQVFFKHFANKNQLPGFYISETLVKNGLIGLFTIKINGLYVRLI